MPSIPILTLPVLLALLPTLLAAQAGACELEAGDRRWAQEALDSWETVRRDFLGVERTPLAPMVLFGAECAWYLAPDTAASPALHRRTAPSGAELVFVGGRVPVRALRHGGTVPLPHGEDVPAAALAFAAPYGEGGASFFVMAAPSVWKREPRHAAEPDLGGFFQGVFAHEMTHTLQVAAVVRRVEALRARYTLPEDFDDDVVQKRFESVPGFRAAYEAERDLLYRAALEPDRERRRGLARSALAAARERRARFFTGADAVYAELEDAFLNMEGAANWAAFHLAKARTGAGATDAEVLASVRGSGRWWSQDEGLALFLTLDSLLPGWQARVLGSEPASVFALLEEAAR